MPDYTELTGRPTFATVAISGSYTDLTNIPTTIVSTTATQTLSGLKTITGVTRTGYKGLKFGQLGHFLESDDADGSIHIRHATTGAELYMSSGATGKLQFKGNTADAYADIYTTSNKPTPAAIGAIPSTGAFTITGAQTFAGIKGAAIFPTASSARFQDGANATMHIYGAGNSLRFASGLNGETTAAEMSSGGTLTTTGYIR